MNIIEQFHLPNFNFPWNSCVSREIFQSFIKLQKNY